MRRDDLEQRIDKLLPSLCQTARKAGEAILDVYRQNFAVSNKIDDSPVTAADLAAEACILSSLAKLTPDIPAISEEDFYKGSIPDISSGVFWLVDPLDGTKEFVKKNGNFTVNMGLIAQGVPVAGVLYAPVGEMLYFANGSSAFMQRNNGPVHPILTRAVPAEGMDVLSSRTHRNPGRFDAFIKPFPVKQIRHYGSSLKMGMIAAGEADLYPRFGLTMEWDTAAGHAIVNAAGGAVLQPDGSPLIYGKPGFKNPPFVVWGRRPQG